MPPGRLTSPHEAGPATEVFSLGAVLGYAATRPGPFDSASPWETAPRIIDHTPDLDGVPDDPPFVFVRPCLKKPPRPGPPPTNSTASCTTNGCPTAPGMPGPTRPPRPRPSRTPPRPGAGTVVLAQDNKDAPDAPDALDTLAAGTPGTGMRRTPRVRTPSPPTAPSAHVPPHGRPWSAPATASWPRFTLADGGNTRTERW
ncbi:hypothetical protein AB5J72_17430 [Streptomyces sp. CG1]|uniref:hypothetical protein n=1 Tax=Streptomyces sp. CG1 TaxID=1287523 RepID=UPI0034E26AE2